MAAIIALISDVHRAARFEVCGVVRGATGAGAGDGIAASPDLSTKSFHELLAGAVPSRLAARHFCQAVISEPNHPFSLPFSDNLIGFG
jgi:hypothetical protein